MKWKLEAQDKDQWKKGGNGQKRQKGRNAEGMKGRWR